MAPARSSPPPRSPGHRAARIVLAMLAAFASATCDAATVLGPSRVENIAMAFVGDSSVIIGGRIAPRVEVRVDGALVAEPRLRYHSSDTTIVGINATGDSLIARRIGSVIITAVLESSMLPKHPPAVIQRVDVTVGEILNERPNLNLSSIGDTATLGVTVLDINGQPVSGIAVTWRSSDTTIVTIDSRGRARARGNGSANAYGIVGVDTVTTIVRVEQQVARIALSPTYVRLDAIGASAPIAAVVLDRNDSAMVGATPQWSVDDATIATVGLDGTVRSARNGETWAYATVGERRDSARVIVDQRAMLVVISTPSGLTIPAVGDELQLVAVGFDRLSKDVTDSRPTWYSLDPVVAQVDAQWGKVRGLSDGSARIVASQDGAEDTVIVRVTNVPITLTVLPGAATMASVGDTLPLQVALRNSADDIVSTSANWHTPEPNIVQVNPDGRVIARARGTARVIASASGLADTAVITVTNAVASIDIVPATVGLRFLGDTLTPEVRVRNARGDLLSATEVTWSSDVSTVASVSPAGRITAHSVGFTYVRASSGAARDSVRVDVENGPQSIVISLVADTMTAPMQQLQVTSVVRSSTGSIMSGYATEWSTSNPAVATISSAGVLTATGYGSASVIGRAGVAADTGTIVVRNPTKITVDNASTAVPGIGTPSRPFTRIGDAVAIATAFDTVYVIASGIPYTEMVNIQSRILLLGDSAAYVANADASRLPTISHDTGSSGILITTGLPVTVRYFAIRHAIEGTAVDVRATDVRLEHIHVNPGSTAPVGSGILIANAPALAVVENSTVRAVRGFGVRFANSAGVRAAGVDVRHVTSLTGYSGGGIVIDRGSSPVVDRVVVRNTVGPQVQLDTTSGATVSSSDLAGRAQLVRLTGLTGSSMISGNTFNLSRQPGEAFTLGSESDGRSGLEIRLSGNVIVSGNVFTEPGSQQMDAIRLIDARSGAGGGATILANQFSSGRYSVASLRSTWSMTGARSTGAVIPVVAEATDTITLASDTLENASGSTCLRSTGSTSRVTIASSVFRGCTAAGLVTGGPAITVSGSGTSLTVTNSDLSGPDQTAITFAAHTLLVRGTRMSGAGVRSVSGFARPAVVDVDNSGPVTIVGNEISGYTGLTGFLAPEGIIRVDSNRVTRNATGIRVIDPRDTQLRGNDIFDNVAIGTQQDRQQRILNAEGNWWGDSRGPRRGDAPAATGDTTVGVTDFTPFATAPHAVGSVAASLRSVRGDAQEGPALTTLPKALTVRVVTADGRPVPGVPVTFNASGPGSSFGGSSTRTVTSDGSGLAEVSLNLGIPGQVTISVSAAGIPSLTLTATSR